MLRILYFTASWCGPCRMFGPIMEQAQASHSGIEVVKVDVDQNPQLVSQYEVRSVPMLIFTKNGVAVEVRHGVVQKSELDKLIHQHK